MEYRKILKRSAELTWRNRLLWVLGILAALFAGGTGWGGNPGSGMRYTTNSQEMQQLWGRLNLPDFAPGRMPFSWEQFAALGIGLALLIVMVVVVLAIVGAIVRYTAEGALIVAVDDLEGGAKPTFRDTFRRGWGRFLRLLAQDLVIGFVTGIAVLVGLMAYAIVAGLLLAPGIIMIVNDGGARVLGIIWVVLFGLVFGLALIAVLTVVGIVETAVRAYAQRSSMLRLEGVFDAISSGLKLFRAKWRETVKMWLGLAAVSIVAGLALGLAAMLMVAISAALVGGLYAVSRSEVLVLITALPLGIVFLLAMLWVSGLLTAFRSSVWTLTFNELASAPVAVPAAAPVPDLFARLAQTSR